MQTGIVLLTGGSSGIGLEVAQQLMNRGFCVYSASRRGGSPQWAEQGSGRIIPVVMDVNDSESVTAVVARIVEEAGRLDVLVCNAGNGVAGSIEDTSEDEMRYQLETNFFGAVKTIQACLPLFREQGHGKIITTSSVAAVVPIPFQAFYSAGKSALSIFMQALAMEVKPFGIQCCTVLPGDTKTDFTSARKYTELSANKDSVYFKKMKKSVGKMEKDELNGMKPSFVAAKIVRQASKRKMNAVVVPGLQYKLICGVINIVPAKLKLWIINLLY